MPKYEEELTELFYLLTENRIESREEIADATGWSVAKVGGVLTTIRRPAEAQAWGWTIPHVPRGRGEGHWFQVIAIDSSKLDDDQLFAINEGSVSTLRSVEAMGDNQAHALRQAAKIATPRDAKRLRRVAKALEGSAAMAGEMADHLVQNGVL